MPQSYKIKTLRITNHKHQDLLQPINHLLPLFLQSLSQTTCWWSAPNHFHFQFSCSVVYSRFPTIQSMEFFRPEYWSGQPFPSPGDLPKPGIEPKSPTLQADSLPAEPPGKPKNTGVGSLTILQQIFLTRESNWGLLHCRRILYQLSYQGSPRPTNHKHLDFLLRPINNFFPLLPLFLHKSLSQTTCWWSAPNHFQFQFSCSVVSDSLQPMDCSTCQASLSIINYRSLLKHMPIKSVMPVWCCPIQFKLIFAQINS